MERWSIKDMVAGRNCHRLISSVGVFACQSCRDHRSRARAGRIWRPQGPRYCVNTMSHNFHIARGVGFERA